MPLKQSWLLIVVFIREDAKNLCWRNSRTLRGQMIQTEKNIDGLQNILSNYSLLFF